MNSHLDLTILENNSIPKVVIRQSGMEVMTFYFPQIDKAYSTDEVRSCVRDFEPD